jgi:glutathione S-transferase
MHGGFMALRLQLPMDLRARLALKANAAAEADIARVAEIWRDARARFGRQGPFLFGAFTAADAMYAPVATRFRTYGVALDPVSQGYVEAVLALPALREWEAAAVAETEVITF